MHSQPYRVWTGLANSMFGMAWDCQMISFFHCNQFAAFEFQSGIATQDNHPLTFQLIVPEADWTAMGLGNDALNSDSFIVEQCQKLFLPRRRGKISKDIFNANSHCRICNHSTPNRQYGAHNQKGNQ